MSTNTVTLGVISMMETSEEKKAKNYFHKLFALCEQFLPGSDCDLVLLPELGACLPEDSQSLDGEIIQHYAKLAQEHKIYLIAPLSEKDGEKLYNTQVVISPTGELIYSYRKVHLAPGEGKTYSPGTHFVPFDLPWFKAGIVICYDNQFPESTRCLAVSGAQVIFFPSHGDPKKPHRNPARCIDNHVYLLGAGIIDLSCEGYTAMDFEAGFIMSPSGEILSETGPQEGLAKVELSLDKEGRLIMPKQNNIYLNERQTRAYKPLV